MCANFERNGFSYERECKIFLGAGVHFFERAEVQLSKMKYERDRKILSTSEYLNNA